MSINCRLQLLCPFDPKLKETYQWAKLLGSSSKTVEGRNEVSCNADYIHSARWKDVTNRFISLFHTCKDSNRYDTGSLAGRDCKEADFCFSLLVFWSCLIEGIPRVCITEPSFRITLNKVEIYAVAINKRRPYPSFLLRGEASRTYTLTFSDPLLFIITTSTDSDYDKFTRYNLNITCL